MNVQQAKQIPIFEYLARLGYQPQKKSGTCIMYLSMLTPAGENTPSFQVSLDGHAFHDWSSGNSGSIIDLAMCITGKRDVSAALAHIEATVGQSTLITANPTSSSFYQQRSLDIIAVKELTSRALLAYAEGRGIPADIAQTYCHEVHYHTANSSKELYSLGWPNDSGGWELRNRFSKLASAPKDISTINDLCDCTFLVFEGFFDFLSAATLRWFRPERMNAIVLNSTALLERALPVLAQANRVICLLDNDNAGHYATNRIRKSCALAEDYTHLYAGYKDLNEYLLMNDSLKE